MLISSINRNSLILSNIQQTLQQIKVSGVPNQRLSLGESPESFGLFNMTLEELYNLTLPDLSNLQIGNGTSCTVDFYTDQAKTNLLFSENSTGNSSSFSTINNKLFYTPPDYLINNAASLSTTLNQQLYYVTATFTNGNIIDTIYKNVNNLLFQQVIVASKAEPEYAGNANVAVLTVNPEVQTGKKNSDFRIWNLPSYDLTVYINILDWATLSEFDRLQSYQNNSNIITNALKFDLYRGGNSSIYDNNIVGTQISTMKPLPSKNRMKGILTIKCAYLSTPGTN